MFIVNKDGEKLPKTEIGMTIYLKDAYGSMFGPFIVTHPYVAQSQCGVKIAIEPEPPKGFDWCFLQCFGNDYEAIHKLRVYAPAGHYAEPRS